MKHWIFKNIVEKSFIKITTIDNLVYHCYYCSQFSLWIVCILVTDFHFDWYIFLSWEYIHKVTMWKNEKNYETIIWKIWCIKPSYFSISPIIDQASLCKGVWKHLVMINSLLDTNIFMFWEITTFSENSLWIKEFNGLGKLSKKCTNLTFKEIWFLWRKSEYLSTYEKYVMI